MVAYTESFGNKSNTIGNFQNNSTLSKQDLLDIKVVVNDVDSREYMTERIHDLATDLLKANEWNLTDPPQ